MNLTSCNLYNFCPVLRAERAGGSFVKFSCQKTALSQTHLTGERIKKSLSERVHYDKSGFAMHRDLFSAYLARFVNQDELLLDLLGNSDRNRWNAYTE
jgi:hypothetical protein